MENDNSIHLDPRVFQDIANRYRNAHSPEEKDIPRQALDEWLDKLKDENLIKVPSAAKIPWDLLRMSGLPEQALRAVVELRGTRDTRLVLNAIITLSNLIVKMNLDADGFVFGEAVIVNIPGLATQVSEIAQQPQHADPRIFSAFLGIILPLNRAFRGERIFAKPAGTTVIGVLLDSLFSPIVDLSVPISTAYVAYRILAQLSRQAFGPTGTLNERVTILDGFQEDLASLLSRYPPGRIIGQMTRHLGHPPDEAAFRHFCSVFSRFVKAGSQMRTSLLRHGKLHVPILKGWWAVHRGAFKPAMSAYGRPSSVTWHGDAVGHIYSIVSATGSRDLKWTVIRDLINEGDLVLLFAQLIATRESREDIAGDIYSMMWTRDVIMRIADCFSGNKHLLETRVRNDWVYARDRLRVLQCCRSGAKDDTSRVLAHPDSVADDEVEPDPLEIWSLFATSLGLDIKIVQDECFDATQAPPGGQIGCSWVKCLLYGDDTAGLGVTLSRCGGCKLTTYCSLACQKADWKAGGHHLVCARHQSMLKGP